MSFPRIRDLDLGEPGVFECGDTLVRVGAALVNRPIFAGRPTEDGRRQFIQTCNCGGWYTDFDENYRRLPDNLQEPPGTGMCTD